MSSLIFYTTESDIVLATDTLAVIDQAGTPLLYTTKFYPLPHLGGVICGTGVGQLVIDWFAFVNSRMVVKDLTNLDYHAPRCLRELTAAGHYRVPGIRDTTTIYHLGFPADEGPPCVFAYRSTNDFASERLPVGGLAVKPECDIPVNYTLPADFETMMNSQREHQERRPMGERVYIGGDIIVCHMTRQRMSIYRGGHFPDRDAMLDEMFRRLSG